ncbi:MAG: methylmalonyl-CoA epimerase [Desulfurococcaceae archaeon]|nr:methylmalonyl-CoA epimerase [Desulfurococcaceae archaeon]
MRIDHIGIAVKNLDEAVKFYKDVLGLELEDIEEVPEENVRVAMFRVGETYIELLQGTTQDSAISKFIEKRGEGIHHIAIRVDDVDRSTEILKSRGAVLVYDKARLVSKGSRKINFVHPKSTGGVLLELVERVGRE